MKKDSKNRRTPLDGRRVVVTRPRHQAGGLVAALQALGAEVIEIPTVRIELMDDTALRSAIRQLGQYEVIVFTSRNAVEVFLDVLEPEGVETRRLQDHTIAAVGRATAGALAEAGVTAQVVADRATAEGLVEKLKAELLDVRGKRILFPKALDARDVIEKELKKMGGRVDAVPVYRTVPEDPSRIDGYLAALGAPPDVITFTSPSTVSGFQRLVSGSAFSAIREESIAACIGPVTARAAEAAGFHVAIVPEVHSADGLAESIADYFGGGSR